ncbi:MAG: hypothetical protein AABY34_02360, partial [Pseudomonadota bacterium]
MKTQHWALDLTCGYNPDPSPFFYSLLSRPGPPFGLHNDYLLKRGNGDEPFWFITKFPNAAETPDAAFSWVAQDGKRVPVERHPSYKDYFLCPKEVQYKKDDGYWYADLRLDETPLM